MAKYQIRRDGDVVMEFADGVPVEIRVLDRDGTVTDWFNVIDALPPSTTLTDTNGEILIDE